VIGLIHRSRVGPTSRSPRIRARVRVVSLDCLEPPTVQAAWFTVFVRVCSRSGEPLLLHAVRKMSEGMGDGPPKQRSLFQRTFDFGPVTPEEKKEAIEVAIAMHNQRNSEQPEQPKQPPIARSSHGVTSLPMHLGAGVGHAQPAPRPSRGVSLPRRIGANVGLAPPPSSSRGVPSLPMRTGTGLSHAQTDSNKRKTDKRKTVSRPTSARPTNASSTAPPQVTKGRHVKRPPRQEWQSEGATLAMPQRPSSVHSVSAARPRAAPRSTSSGALMTQIRGVGTADTFVLDMDIIMDAPSPALTIPTEASDFFTGSYNDTIETDVVRHAYKLGNTGEYLWSSESGLCWTRRIICLQARDSSKVVWVTQLIPHPGRRTATGLTFCHECNEDHLSFATEVICDRAELDAPREELSHFKELSDRCEHVQAMESLLNKAGHGLDEARRIIDPEMDEHGATPVVPATWPNMQDGVVVVRCGDTIADFALVAAGPICLNDRCSRIARYMRFCYV
jgi:hypothetical protein